MSTNKKETKRPGINLDKIRQRLENLTKTNGPSATLRLEEGDQVLRILPMPDGDPFKDVHIHYNVAGNTFVCPKRTYNEPCKACDLATELWKSGTIKNDDAIKNMAKSLFPTHRFFAPVLKRGAEADGAKWWGHSQKAYELFLKTTLDPDYGDISDSETGTDFTVSYTKPTKGDKFSFPKIEIFFKRKTSTLCEEDTKGEKCQELLKSIPDFSDVVPRKTPAEIEVALKKMLEPEGEDEANDSNDDLEKYKKENKDADPIDKAFDELLPDSNE